MQTSGQAHVHIGGPKGSGMPCIRVCMLTPCRHAPPEQKRGRDSSAETRRVLEASACNHHFVSSWMEHNHSRHHRTDASRRGVDASVVWQQPVVDSYLC